MTPKTLLAFAGFFVVWLMAGAASAASPAYCALYAREYAIDIVQPSAAPGMLQSVQDQAYARCLNQDEDPPLPRTSAYFGTPLAKAPPATTATASVKDDPPKPSAQPAPKPAVATASAKEDPPKASAQPTPRPAPSQPVVTASASKPYRGSQLQAWTPEWEAWCARNFPNSWDAKTGTILHYDRDKRELCK